jgi:hypothetical protein
MSHYRQSGRQHPFKPDFACWQDLKHEGWRLSDLLSGSTYDRSGPGPYVELGP